MLPPSPPIILGSASPRRAELLAQLGLTFRVRAADIDETPGANETPRDYVQRMARDKASRLVQGCAQQERSGQHFDGSVLLTADTTVVLGEQSLGKPQSADEARYMLQALSGSVHQVYTAVCAQHGERTKELLVCTAVEFAVLSPELISDYLAGDEPWDKAGAYAIQGLGGSFVRRIDGSVTNVIGLPLVETRELLAIFGVHAGLRRSSAPANLLIGLSNGE